MLTVCLLVLLMSTFLYLCNSRIVFPSISSFFRLAILTDRVFISTYYIFCNFSVNDDDLFGSIVHFPYDYRWSKLQQILVEKSVPSTWVGLNDGCFWTFGNIGPELEYVHPLEKLTTIDGETWTQHGMVL